MSDSAINNPSSRELLGKIMKLQRQIERKASLVAKPGFFLNMWGTHDKQDLTDSLFCLFSELLEQAPNEDYFRFLFAGALARAKRLDESAAEYAAVLSSNGGYAEPAALMLAGVLLQKGNRAAAEAALTDYNQRVEGRGATMLIRKLQDLEVRAP